MLHLTYYYVRINFSTLVKLIDEIGGVDINSDASFNKRGCNINYGFNHLNPQLILKIKIKPLLHQI